MELNPTQNKLISDFALKYCHENNSGNIKPEAHLTDVRQLVEACLQAEEDQEKGGENE